MRAKRPLFHKIVFRKNKFFPLFIAQSDFHSLIVKPGITHPTTYKNRVNIVPSAVLKAVFG